MGLLWRTDPDRRPSWCRDVPYVDFFGGDLCETMTAPNYRRSASPPSRFSTSARRLDPDRPHRLVLHGFHRRDLNRAGRLDDLGRFFPQARRGRSVKHAVLEPISISGNGKVVTGGMVGVAFSWIVEMGQVFVCDKGRSVSTSFPDGLRAKVAAGAPVRPLRAPQRLNSSWGWDFSTTKRVAWKAPRTRSALERCPCRRNSQLPMRPSWTGDGWRARLDSNQ